ncbi:hypothetical protein GCM10018785_23600 [Streptomyces longispororuber]|uniref:ANTAR domain-containing protein n=1 Tax=Streptomyces longispororuber TaxID=68230 RepID=A0A918ZIK1_9ACTN|nr:ANTAR domain-containing protein [Streptomyces longispororuber]GHE53331.1 hypothetical protein GCM10018785_23600 [Streptomyces longispororuber]
MPKPTHAERGPTGETGKSGGGLGNAPRAPLPEGLGDAAPYDFLPREGALRGALPRDARARVPLAGELDLDAAQRLRVGLFRALKGSADGVDLDLGGVDFCDCSGLNLLLSLRQEAVRQGKTVAVRTGSRAVDRLLDLTGTRPLFAPPGPEDGDPGGEPFPPAAREGGVREDSDEELRVVVAQLRRAMRTRPTIDLARGILMSSFGLSPEAAWDVLVAASQNTNTKLHRLAGDLVGTVRGEALPEAVHQQLVAAVVKTSAARSSSAT